MMKTRVVQLRQALDEVRENPVGLPAATAAEVARALNVYLASAYVLYHQYKKNHWVVEGPEFWSIHKLLDEHAAGVLEDADRVAERITALGAVPVSGPAKQEEMSVVKPEPEGIFDLRSMLENDLQAEGTVIRTLRDCIRLVYDPGACGQSRQAALPVGMAAAAGAMLFAVCHHLIPESHGHGHSRGATLALLGGVAAALLLQRTGS